MTSALRVHRDEGPAAGGALELHAAIAGREDRVVAAHADIGAGMVSRAALAHDDVAREHRLIAILLHAEALAGRIAAVTGAAACFFVSHGWLLLALLRGGLLLGRRLLACRLLRGGLGGCLRHRLPDGGLALGAGRRRQRALRGLALLGLGLGRRLGGVLRRGVERLAVGQDIDHAQQRQRLTMAALAPVVMTALLLEDD